MESAGRQGRAPQVPGYRLTAPVGFGAGGAVWAATDTTGRAVAVAFLALAPGERGTAQLRRLGALRAVVHPHLPRVRDVVGLDGGRCALVSEVVPGPSLATVHAARGPLTPPEAATVLAAVGAALGHLHARGVVHGDVAPTNVLLAPGGVPVLVDLAGEVTGERGTAGFVAPERAAGQPASAAGDVWALARLLLWATDDHPDVRRAVAPALAADPGARPSPRDLAARALELAAAEPVHLPEGAQLASAQLRAGAGLEPTRRQGGGRPRRRAQRRRPRWGIVAAVALAVAGGVVVGASDGGRVSLADLLPAAGGADPGRGSGTGEGGGPGAGGGASEERASQDRESGEEAGTDEQPDGTKEDAATADAPDGQTAADAPDGQAAVDPPDGQTVGDLLERRDAVITQGDRDALAGLTVPGSPAALEDTRLWERLDGQRVEGLRTELVDVALVEAPTGDGAAAGGGSATAVVQVVTRQGPYRLVGEGVREVPATGQRCARLTLVGPEPWRVQEARPCPPSAGGGELSAGGGELSAVAGRPR
ncbi:serine/threonine-protein kinase [Georgenia sp. TF02-10]|uniref:serine/threonine-protein kinase n=1 Tax=Georgenia sp. TF02-10 TaxID=2917725 RepID=UPI002739B0F4|nr:protein kinase [Georgenia sp. TF02-10]